MGMVAILAMWLGPFKQTFVPTSHRGSICNLASIGLVHNNFTFSHTKHKWPNLTLALNRSRSTYGHHLNKLWQARVSNAKNQVSKQSAHWFQRRFLEGFYQIWSWWPSWSCDWIYRNKFSLPSSHELSHEFLLFNGLVISEKNKFEFWNLSDLGPRSRNDPDLKYSCNPIYPFSWLHLPHWANRLQ